MIVLTGLSLLLGAVLGLRFKVFVLIPVIIFGLVLSTIAGIARGADLWSLIAAMIVALTGLQLGYLGGTAAISFIFSAQGTERSRRSPRTNEDIRTVRIVPESAFRLVILSLADHLRSHYRPVLGEPSPFI